jgi:hypothetical protein
LGRRWQQRRVEHRRQILRSCANSDTYSNTYHDGHAYGYSDAHDHAMRGKMYTDAAAAPYAGTAPVTFIRSPKLGTSLWNR